jgi:hypothetical protein
MTVVVMTLSSARKRRTPRRNRRFWRTNALLPRASLEDRSTMSAVTVWIATRLIPRVITERKSRVEEARG